jgi:hypothetical protein
MGFIRTPTNRLRFDVKERKTRAKSSPTHYDNAEKPMRFEYVSTSQHHSHLSHRGERVTSSGQKMKKKQLKRRRKHSVSRFKIERSPLAVSVYLSSQPAFIDYCVFSSLFRGVYRRENTKQAYRSKWVKTKTK